MELRAFTPEEKSSREESSEPQGFLLVPEKTATETKDSGRSFLLTALRRLADAAAFALFLGALGAAAFLILSI